MTFIWHDSLFIDFKLSVYVGSRVIPLYCIHIAEDFHARRAAAIPPDNDA